MSQLLRCRSQWEEQEQACSDLMLFDCYVECQFAAEKDGGFRAP